MADQGAIAVGVGGAIRLPSDLTGFSIHAASPGVGVAGEALPAILARNTRQGVGKTISGAVTINGAPASRRVRLFDRESGALLQETVSAADGSFSFWEVHHERKHQVMAVPEAGDGVNAVIFDFVEGVT
ncbi:MAG: hypothetical protein HQL51_03890 [Magnetococcales bacterium]|nr:hypothetical protein [Magnetococcales bacterium]